MRKLSFKYTFVDNLEIPDGATQSEIDNLISQKVARMADAISDEVWSKDSYVIQDTTTTQR